MENLEHFAEKYLLARQSSLQAQPISGLCGSEIEWNLLDTNFKPLLTIGAGPGQLSFVDFLRSECLTPHLSQFSQLEVFHWMIEWATRPYYQPRGAVYEGRLMEAALINGLHRAGKKFNERLYAWHGNLLFPAVVDAGTIPGSWHLAKRRYLERCVDLYGNSLATAGTHTNLSLPDALFEWDFIHLPPGQRTGGSKPPLHLDEFKSEFYITGTRLMRAFASLFIATSASTPFRPGMQNGSPAVYLTSSDSVRNLTFPNPSSLDLPNLYRSYQDYLDLSYDLVRQGTRFGNNNWTPVRARSFAEPVERLIAMTSEQLLDLYARGLFSAGEVQSMEEMAHQIEIQNLLARINLPMARVEVRTDDGGNPMQVEIANLTLKHLLLLTFYADPTFARSFRYDQEDIQRARRNEELAAQHGLRAEIENPLSAKPVGMREFLNWTLATVRPLAELLEFWSDLEPLREMAAGGPNSAEYWRTQVLEELNMKDFTGELLVPIELLKEFSARHETQVVKDVELIAETHGMLGLEAGKLGELLQYARDDVHLDPEMPVRFRPRPQALLEIYFPDKTSEIVALAEQLVAIPSVTACPNERLDEVRRAATFIFDYLRNHGLEVTYFDQDKYPAILAGFPGAFQAPVVFSGHFDVVEPEPDDRQFEPRLEGDFLWGRGAADMKTVVATYLVWFKDTLKKHPIYPPVNLLLVGNEENGETEAMGTPHVLNKFADEGYSPGLLIAGERTGEQGDELWGEICVQNRGVVRLELRAKGVRNHSGIASGRSDLTERLVMARNTLINLMENNLTLHSQDGWQSQARFPFIQVGTQGIFNISPDSGVLGIEIRPIPQDDMTVLLDQIQEFCRRNELDLQVLVNENGIACDPYNPYLTQLIASVRYRSGAEPRLGRKLPGTSARFAPRGQGIVWGQTGIGPHSRDERHFIPSILPYYQVLDEYGQRLLKLAAIDKSGGA